MLYKCSFFQVCALLFWGKDIKNWNVLLVNFFMSMWCPFLSLLIHFALKSIFQDIKMATSAVFLALFAWYIFFNPLTWGDVYSWCWSMWDLGGLCSRSINSVLALLLFVPLIEKLRLLMLRAINDQWLFLPIIYLLVSWVGAPMWRSGTSMGPGGQTQIVRLSGKHL